MQVRTKILDMASEISVPASRQERRKAETRRRIVTAADRLFQERGYSDTSIEEIASAADVATRTIYLHFGSKAAIMLSYFDGWLDAYTAAILERAADEPVAETIDAAVAAISEAGWIDRVEGGDERPHPLVEHLADGSPDIAGHVMHRWLHAVSRMTADMAARTQPSGSVSLDPHTRAMAVFTHWLGSMTIAREKQIGGAVPHDATGMGMLKGLTSGAI